MANLKDLIVNGASRFIGPIYGTASNAITAGYTLYATSASWAIHSASAGYATSAAQATHAASANYSQAALTSSYAVTALRAISAGSAGYAASATNAAHAQTAHHAGSATYATKAAQDAAGNSITGTYVHKAGDTMSGTLQLQNSIIYGEPLTTTYSGLCLSGGSSWGQGACMSLRNYDTNNSIQGGWYIESRISSTSTTYTLINTPGSGILRYTDQTNFTDILPGRLELSYSGTPYIDFHRANSTADYTARIINNYTENNEALCLDAGMIMLTANSKNAILYPNGNFNVWSGNICAGYSDVGKEVTVIAHSSAGQIYLFSQNSTTGNRGIYTQSSSGVYTDVITVDSNNNISLNGTAKMLTMQYTNNATTYDNFKSSNLTCLKAFTNWWDSGNTRMPYVYGSGILIPHGDSNFRSIIYARCNTGELWYQWGTLSAPSEWKHIWVEGNSITAAVWNDYAEYRETDTIEAGRCVTEVGDDSMILSTKRLQKGCSITSDTWGFAQGQTEKAQTPIAVSGRVLAYPYEDREEFKKHIGDAVCSGPDGTVSIMTDEEVVKYPLSIIGTISAIPDYEEWGGGTNREPVKVNGRVWIRIR